MFDSHTHTGFSHDSSANPLVSCEKALAIGLNGIAFTDHADIEYADSFDIFGKFRNSFSEINRIKHQFCGRLEISNGIEIGEWIWNRPAVERLLSESDFDVVLGSVHAVRYQGFTQPYSSIDFRSMTEKQLSEFIDTYFDDYLETVCTCDADVFTHLTCPWRYIVGKFGLRLDIDGYYPKIKAILSAIIQKDAAFELNTSCLGDGYGELMPTPDILRMYADLGGDKILLGSDAHTSGRVGHGFGNAVSILKQIGFTQAYYFINRKPISYKI